ncbi:hypothetical protein CISIN_1g035074mg [Citrus sinensis]|uniref:Uncharacterized protein n=1 Tax=Citrus sinensis TaxID=2711 RepID=A0A067D1V1_CITSI|nr:hypothetical protein CISIN_1g035074mg [Citrus sinensis]
MSGYVSKCILVLLLKMILELYFMSLSGVDLRSSLECPSSIILLWEALHDFHLFSNEEKCMPICSQIYQSQYLLL